MFRKFLRSKIHRATVTQADLDYEGSLTIPPDLMRAAAIAPYESVHVWNVTRGTRLETYAITGEEGARDICVNGAAAHLVRPGDVIIIATFAYAVSETSEFAPLEPRVVFVDSENRIQHMGAEVPGPRRRDLPNSSSINSCC